MFLAWFFRTGVISIILFLLGFVLYTNSDSALTDAELMNIIGGEACANHRCFHGASYTTLDSMGGVLIGCRSATVTYVTEYWARCSKSDG